MTNKLKLLLAPALLSLALAGGPRAQAQDQSAPPPPTQNQTVQTPAQPQAQDQPAVQSTDQSNDQPTDQSMDQSQDQQNQDQQAPDQDQSQDQSQQQTQAPPPPPGQQAPAARPNQQAPGVARISMIHGSVSTQRADSGDVSAATLNTPLENGDQISTGNNSRTEVQLDYANVLRLAANSQATIATLDRHHIQVQVGDGLAYFSTYRGNEAQVEVDTPNVAVRPTNHEASFRLLVNSGGETDVIVRHGDVDVSTPDGSKRVHHGEMIAVRGLNNDVKFKVSDAPGKDDWDTFNQNRDRVIQSAQSWRYTDRYYTGSQDLDSYGTWSEVPDYGRVWIPSQGPDWAPYSDGSWVYQPYYGWTWVSSEPWGWAPYHYGRWFVYGGSWAWWPGPIGVGFGYYPIWAPAYVSFFGFGGGFGFGFGFGSFGWLPIGPCDFFHPWWGGFGGRFGFVGFRDFPGAGWRPLARGNRFSNLRSVESNARVRSGLTTVGSGAFGHGAVHGTAASLAQVRSSHVMTGNLPVVPSHASLSASGKFESKGSMMNGGSQHFFTRSTPAAKPASFSQETSNLRSSIQKSGTTPITAGERGSASASGRTEAGRGATANANRPSTKEANRADTSRGTANRGETANKPEGNTANTGRQGATDRSFQDRPPASRPAGNSSVSLDRQGRYTDSSNGVKSSVGNPGETARPANDGWQRFSPSTGPGNGSVNGPTRPGSAGTANRGTTGSARSGSMNGGSRPPLQMNKPIVSSRPSYGGNPGYSRAPYGGQSRPASPGYSAPSRAPSYGGGGSHSAPSYHAPSGGGGGHPSSGGGGGHSGGGGGHGGGGGGHH